MTSEATQPNDVWAGCTPRRWQSDALQAVIDAMVAGDRRPLVQACTGAGKSILIGALAAAAKRGPILITTPTQALVDQLARTVERHVGKARVGRAYQYAWQLDRDVVVACIPSLSKVLDERPEWAVWIADEAHRLEGDETREIRERMTTEVAIGFTATPFRADERGLVLWDRIAYRYTSHDAVQDGVLVPFRVVRAEADDDVDDLTESWVRQAEGPGIVSALTVDDAAELADRLGALSIHGRLKRAERERRIAALQAGDVPCLVHVQLLTEGIDLPWLRWLVLRRPVKSPVRLVQEVGRVLRCAPDKSEAVLYDPHDLLGEIGLTHAAALENAQAKDPSLTPGGVWSPPSGGGSITLEMPRAKPVHPHVGWVIDVLGALRAQGLADPADPRWAGDAQWRYEPVTAGQRKVLDEIQWVTRHLQPGHSKILRRVLRAPELAKGTASDLISILFALQRQFRGSPSPRTGIAPDKLPIDALPPVPDLRRSRYRRMVRAAESAETRTEQRSRTKASTARSPAIAHRPTTATRRRA